MDTGPHLLWTVGGQAPQKASEELWAVQYCPPQTYLITSCRISTKPCHSPAFLGGLGGAAWEAVGGATPGRATGPASLLPRPWHSSAQRLGHAIRPFSMDHAPWRWARGTFWIINHESGHGSCPLLRPNGSRGLIIELRADSSIFRPFQPQSPLQVRESG